MSQPLKNSLHLKHTPRAYPRKTVAIKMLQVEDDQFFNQDEECLAMNSKDNHQDVSLQVDVNTLVEDVYGTTSKIDENT